MVHVTYLYALHLQISDSHLMDVNDGTIKILIRSPLLCLPVSPSQFSSTAIRLTGRLHGPITTKFM